MVIAMKIKPCPFCGNKDVYTLPVYDSKGYYTDRFRVVCEECNISFECGDGNQEKAVIEAWNKRANDKLMN